MGKYNPHRREYMRLYMRLRRARNQNVNPTKKRNVNTLPSRQEVFTDTVLPTHEATQRWLNTFLKASPWTKLVHLLETGMIVEPATGELLGDLGRLDRLEAIVEQQGERIAALSYRIAEYDMDEAVMRGTTLEEATK